MPCRTLGNALWLAGMKAKTPIQIAAAQFETVAAFARALELKPPTVHQWLDGSREVPAAQCLKIETVTNGTVTRYDLRPTIFGPRPQQAA